MKDPGTCIVVGIETQIGLAIIRELGAAGVRVVALTHDRRAIGLSSRYVHHAEIVAPRSEELLECLDRLGQQFGVCSLIMVSEANLQWLSSHLGRLGQNIRPVVPPVAALAIALDKGLTLEAAARLGIPVPTTIEPADEAEVESIAQTFRFPAVLKWKDPNGVAPRLASLGLPLLKAEYVYSAEEWRRAAARYSPLAEWPLVQQYCRGQGLGQFFFVHEGRVVQRFQHLRIAEWPPEGGFSSVCDAVGPGQHAALLALSERLLLSIGWSGVAMVEYRLDQDSGQAVLMEINGRFWGSYPLASQCGSAFALLAHRAAVGLPLEPVPVPLARWRCRMVLTELKRLRRLLLQPQLIADRQYEIRRLAEIGRFISDFFRPRVGYFVWSWRDPSPWFADLRNMLGKLVGGG